VKEIIQNSTTHSTFWRWCHVLRHKAWCWWWEAWVQWRSFRSGGRIILKWILKHATCKSVHCISMTLDVV